MTTDAKLNQQPILRHVKNDTYQLLWTLPYTTDKQRHFAADRWISDQWCMYNEPDSFRPPFPLICPFCLCCVRLSQLLIWHFYNVDAVRPVWQWKIRVRLVVRIPPNDGHVSKLNVTIDAAIMVHAFPNRIPVKSIFVNIDGLDTTNVSWVIPGTLETFRRRDICWTFSRCIRVSRRKNSHVTAVYVLMPTVRKV